jgi:hypothetical protein
MAKSNVDQFFRQLIDRVPEVLAVVDEHRRDHDEVLPHVLMADIRRFVIAKLQDVVTIDAVVACLEEGIASGNEALQEVIAVSFLENMDPTEPSYEAIANRMGPLLLAELARFRRLWA